MRELQERLLDWLWSRLESPEEEVAQAARTLSPSLGELAEELERYELGAQRARSQLDTARQELGAAGRLFQRYHQQVLELTRSGGGLERRLAELLEILGALVPIQGYRLLREQGEGWTCLGAANPSVNLDDFLDSTSSLEPLRQAQERMRPLLLRLPGGSRENLSLNPQPGSRENLSRLPTRILVVPLVLEGGAGGALIVECGAQLPEGWGEKTSALVSLLARSQRSRGELDQLEGQVQALSDRFDRLPGAFLCLDARGRVCEASREARALLGSALDDLPSHLPPGPEAPFDLDLPAGRTLRVTPARLPGGETLLRLQAPEASPRRAGRIPPPP